MFDQHYDRYQTKSLKYDFKAQRQVPTDVYPLWVADMDFKVPDAVLKALHQRIEHGIFGYTEADDEYYQVLVDWFWKQHQLRIQPQWVIQTPGVVFALAQAVLAFTKPNDKVLIQTPVYYPFYEVIQDNHRIVVENYLIKQTTGYQMDFEQLEQLFKNESIRLMLLCNPHNPVGRSWRSDELKRLIALAEKYQVIIVSDEIHMDLVYPPLKHHSLPTIQPEFKRWVLCTAASKTFNLAGLQLSNIIIEDQQLRQQYRQQIQAVGYSQPNTLGLIATQAAYQFGASWLQELKTYLYQNYLLLSQFFKEKIPQVTVYPLEATYLVWLDFNQLFDDSLQLQQFMLQQAKLWLDDGFIFGKTGAGFQRINIALPYQQLEKVLNQLYFALMTEGVIV